MGKYQNLSTKDVMRLVELGNFSVAYMAVICGAEVDQKTDEEIRQRVEGNVNINGYPCSLAM